MKKITFFLLLCLNFSAYSQDKFGVFTGFNYSYFTDGIAGQVLAEESFGLQLGIVYEKELSAKVHFRPKLAFSHKATEPKLKV